VRRICVILNEGGGTVRTEGPDRQAEMLTSLFAEHGIEASVVFGRGAEMAEKARVALDAAKAGRFEAVAVAGGDGSVSAVAGVLAGGDVPLGVLPLGTLNHFAQDLGMPPKLADAVRAIAAGRTQRVDVAEVNGRVFVNNSSVGLYSYMVAERERQQTDAGRGKWPAMALAALRALRRFPRRRLAIRAEGWTRPCRTPFVFIGNNDYQIELFSLGRRASLQGGGLCLYIVNHQSPWGLLSLALRAAAGRLDQARDFDMRHGLTAVEIDSRTSRLRVAVDGETAILEPPLRYRIRPRALPVLVPPKAAE
jgi:diacylglycerol kinase family enzyme